MSKKARWFMAAGLALVTAAVLLAYFTQRRPMADLRKTMTESALPGVREYLGRLAGRPVKVSYQDMAMTDQGLVLSRVVIATGENNPHRLTIDKAVFTRLEQVFGPRPHWLASGRISGLAGGLTPSSDIKVAEVEFEELRLWPGLTRLAVSSARVRDFSRHAAGGHLALAGLQVKRLRVNKGGSLELVSGQADRLAFHTGPATLKLARLSVLGARVRNLKRLSPFDAGRTEITGLAALQAGRQFLGLGRALVQYDRQGPRRKLTVELSDLSLKGPGAPPAMARQMTELGYRELGLNLRLEAEVDLDSQRLVLQRLALNSPQMGELELGLELSGFRVDPAKLSRMPLWSLLLAQRSVALVSARLTYRDASLAGRLLALQARRRGLTPETFTKVLVAQLQAAAGELGPGMQPLAGALVSFLRRPGELQISLRPPKPLGLLGVTMMKPRTVLQRLGIAAQAR